MSTGMPSKIVCGFDFDQIPSAHFEHINVIGFSLDDIGLDIVML